ncbi:MAG: hypothetical protein ACP5N2_01240 [Candidatus Nanoarchaeia archaeon]
MDTLKKISKYVADNVHDAKNYVRVGLTVLPMLLMQACGSSAYTRDSPGGRLDRKYHIELSYDAKVLLESETLDVVESAKFYEKDNNYVNVLEFRIRSSSLTEKVEGKKIFIDDQEIGGYNKFDTLFVAGVYTGDNNSKRNDTIIMKYLRLDSPDLADALQYQYEEGLEFMADQREQEIRRIAGERENTIARPVPVVTVVRY